VSFGNNEAIDSGSEADFVSVGSLDILGKVRAERREKKTAKVLQIVPGLNRLFGEHRGVLVLRGYQKTPRT
jgi:hypothetical protein